MYEKALARRVKKVVEKRILALKDVNDKFEREILIADAVSMLDMLGDVIKLYDIDTINISKKEG